MTTRLTDPVSALGKALPGDALEALADLLADPGADHSPGELATIGAALAQIGGDLLEQAKCDMAQRLRGGLGADSCETDAGVFFRWHPPTTSQQPDARRVRALFPPTERPELYATRTRRDYVTVSL